MKTTINELLFKKILEGTKHCVAKGLTRPEFEFIRLVVEKDKITAYALDGYRAGRVIITCDNSEEFICYIKPISFKTSKNGTNIVEIEFDNGLASVETVAEFGKMKYSFKQPERFGCDIEKVFKDGKVHDREIGVNAIYMAQAMKALASISVDYNKTTILESKDSKTSAFCVSVGCKDFICDQLILPIRLMGGNKK